jgi:hypothetical protein
MIILERKEPIIVTKIEALRNRISINHPKLEIMNRDYVNFKSGYQGERKLDYFFSLMDQEKYDFYHGLRLSANGKSFFQIDTLIISPSLIPVVEIKNYSSNTTVSYDKKTNQFSKNGAIITNPISQVKLQILQLVDWLEDHKFIPFPVDYLIALSNPASKIECPQGAPEHFWKFCYGHDFLEKLQIYEKSHKMEQIPIKARKRLRKLLLKYHTPSDVDILAKYRISKDDIISGVQCPSCNYIPMDHIYATWICRNCHHKSKSAHLKTVLDHFLLFGPTITNKQFRTFTHIQSIQLAYRYLESMNLPHTGTNKGRLYYSPTHRKKE